MLDTSASMPSSAGSPRNGQVVGARADALGLSPGTPLADLVAALMRASLQSDLDAVGARSARARAEALLAAETARALHALLCGEAEDGTSDERLDDAAPGPDDAPSWDVSARVARMRSWLATRAATDPTARRAAVLCEQVAEALLSAARPGRSPSSR